MSWAQFRDFLRIVASECIGVPALAAAASSGRSSTGRVYRPRVGVRRRSPESTMTHPQDASRPAERSLRAPVLWDVVFGLIQAAAPLGFWWLDAATVYALSLVLIAAVYIGFAVADGHCRRNRGRRRVRGAGRGRRHRTGGGCSCSASSAMGSRTCGSTAVTMLPTRGGGRRSALWSTGSPPPSSSCSFSSASTSINSRADARCAVAGLVDRYGRCDILVAAAGAERRVAELSEVAGTGGAQMDLNDFRCSERGPRGHRIHGAARTGSIVGVASTAALVGVYGYAVYAPSKFAVRGPMEGSTE